MMKKNLIFLIGRKFNEGSYVLKEKSGNSLIEFAFIAPIVILMVIGLVQMSQLMQVRNKMTETGNLLGASITGQTLTQTQISNFCTASFRTFYPIDPTYAQIIISCVYNQGGVVTIPWQINQSGTNMPAQTSRLGPVNSVPSLPSGFSLLSNQSAICVEVFFQMIPSVTSPYFGPLQPQILYTISVHLPCSGRMAILMP